MILYHFTTSPFAQRVRLTLVLKDLSAELGDARADARHAAEVKRLSPLHTVPILVDGERVIPDSNAICQRGPSETGPTVADGRLRIKTLR